MERIWFRRLGAWTIPVSVAGVVATSAAAAFAVNVFVAVDRHSHSVSDTLYGVFPFWACTFLLWNWLAERTGAGSVAR